MSRVKADYSHEGGRIRVVNRGHEAASGRWKEAVGRARPAGEAGEGRLQISFFGPFWGACNTSPLKTIIQRHWRAGHPASGCGSWPVAPPWTKGCGGAIWSWPAAWAIPWMS
ncbi:MAG: lipocalin family protein [bacterium]|nr:lipocalin family protein [bacterium]